MRDEKKLKNNEIKNNFQIEYFFQIKKLQLREQELDMTGKEIEGLMWFFKGIEKNEKKQTCTKLDRITMHAPPKK